MAHRKITTKLPYLPAGLSPMAFDVLANVYGTRIFEVVLTWNHLHESLATLFHTVRGGEDDRVSLEKWYELRNDWRQRRQLSKAAKARFSTESAPGYEVGMEIEWLIDQCDLLADERNDAIHSPFAYSLDDSGPKFVAAYARGNPRAIRLKDKDLIAAFRACAEKAQALANYALALDIYLRQPTLPIPERPW
jgi:hypothetical protein